ncbi:unnamed protein product [Sphagnum balticum]
MRGIAMRLVALWGIFHTIVIWGFRNFVAVMVSGVEEEGSRRGTTTCDAIERHCSGVEQGADPEDSLSGVEEPAGEVIGGVSDVAIRGQGCNGFCIHELPYHATASQTALGI